jgi:uncharacterized membrane protein
MDTNEKKAAGVAHNEIDKAEMKKFKKWCKDLINAPMFAEKMNVKVPAIYYKLNHGHIKAEDIVLICGKRHWSYKKYKHLKFKPHTR